VSEPGPSTRVVRAGLPEPEQGEPFLPGPVFAAPFHLSGDPYSAPASYTRYGNPTWASRTPRRCCSPPGWRPPPRFS
jgi:cystathionine gamma-lyase